MNERCFCTKQTLNSFEKEKFDEISNNAQQIINELKNKILKQLFLTEHKEQIIEYFKQKQFDSKSLFFIKRHQFISDLSDFCNEHRLKGSFGSIWDKLTKPFVELTNCSVVDRIALILSKKDSVSLINIFKECKYSLTHFMNDIHHIFEEHKMISNEYIYDVMSRYIFQRCNIIMCNNSDCQPMQRHCRKDLALSNLRKYDKNNKNKEMELWIALLDKMHCIFHHNKIKSFRYKYEKNDKQKTMNISADNDMMMLQFGVSCDQWLDSENRPTFNNLEEELLNNEYQPIDEQTLNGMQYEIERICGRVRIYNSF